MKRTWSQECNSTRTGMHICKTTHGASGKAEVNINTSLFPRLISVNIESVVTNMENVSNRVDEPKEEE